MNNHIKEINLALCKIDEIFALRTVHRIMCAKVKKNLLFLLLQKFIEYLKSRYDEIEQRNKYGELIYQIF